MSRFPAVRRPGLLVVVSALIVALVAGGTVAAVADGDPSSDVGPSTGAIAAGGAFVTDGPAAPADGAALGATDRPDRPTVVTAADPDDAPDGGAAADSAGTEPSVAATADTTVELELEKAFLDDTDSAVASFSFTADGDGTVAATQSRQSGEVTFSFDSWDGTDGRSGSSSEFTVTAGETYTVYYQVVGESEGEYGSDRQASVSVSVSGAGVSRELTADVNYLEPSFGSADASDVEARLTGDESVTVETTLEFTNDGPGRMKPFDVSADAPSGITVNSGMPPSSVRAGEEGDFDLTITVREDVTEGMHTVYATVEDNLGNTRQVQFQVEVLKVPNLQPSPRTLDVGDLLSDSSESATVTISETTGYDSVSGFSVHTGSTSEINASVSVSGEGQYVSADGSVELDVTVDVDESTARHERLSWTLYVEPEDEEVERTTVRVRALAVHPPQFGETTATSPTYTFDQPRGESEFTERITARVNNSGHYQLGVSSVDVDTPGLSDSSVSADVVQRSGSIPGHEQRTYGIDLTLDSGVPEGTYPVEITLDSPDAESRTIETEITVEHETRLDVSDEQVAFGEVEITQSDARTVDVREALGYDSIEDVTITQVSGPDEGWLIVATDPPSTLDADEEAPTVFQLQFDTDAEVLEEYEWTYRIDGEGVEPKTITVTAKPGIINSEEIHGDLQSYTDGSGSLATAADRSDEMLTLLEDKVEVDELDVGTDLTDGITASRTMVIFLEELDAARTAAREDGRAAAQDHLVRAAAAYNTTRLYVRNISDPEARDVAEEALAAASDALNEEIENQRNFYNERLEEEENTTLLEQSITKRQLARIAVLEGDSERAATLTSEADAEFERYSEHVDTAQEHLSAARSEMGALETEVLLDVEGRLLLTNPAKLDTFDSKRSQVRGHYETAIENFEAAGATERAQSTREEMNEQLGALSFAERSLYVVSGLYVLAFMGVVVRVGRGSLAYVRDADEAVSGDFLI